MESMKIDYLAGCQTCNDGLFEHVTKLVESGEADSVCQAVRWVTKLKRK